MKAVERYMSAEVLERVTWSSLCSQAIEHWRHFQAALNEEATRFLDEITE